MFEYTDPDGDRLTAIGIPNCGRLGPAVSFILKRTDTDTSVGLFIPAGRVEEVVAGIRDAARQAAAQPAAILAPEDAAAAAAWAIASEKAAGQPAAAEREGELPGMWVEADLSSGWADTAALAPAAGLAAPTNHDTEQRARARLAALIGYEPGEHDAKFEQHLDAYRAAVLNSAADAAHAEGDRLYDDIGYKAADAAWKVSDLLRRLAAGAES